MARDADPGNNNLLNPIRMVIGFNWVFKSEIIKLKPTYSIKTYLVSL